MKKILMLHAVFAVCAVLFFSACGKSKEPAPPPYKPPEVTAVKSIKSDIQWQVEYAAKVTGTNVKPKVEGTLKSIKYKEGKVAEKGEVLFEMDELPFKDALTQAKAAEAKMKTEYDKAKTKFNKIHAKNEKGSVSKKDYSAALAAYNKVEKEYNESKQAVKDAEAHLKNTKVQAPIAGVVGPPLQSTGTVISIPEGTGTVAVMSKLTLLQVTFALPKIEADNFAAAYLRGKIKYNKNIGKDAPAVYAEAQLTGGKVFPKKGKMVLYNDKEAAKTGLVTVTAEFPNPEKLKTMLPGTNVKVKLVNAAYKDAVVIPRSCIRDSSVYVLKEDNTAEAVKVVYETDENYAIVISGLTGEETVISEGAEKIEPAKPVNVTLREFTLPEKYAVTVAMPEDKPKPKPEAKPAAKKGSKTAAKAPAGKTSQQKKPAASSTAKKSAAAKNASK